MHSKTLDSLADSLIKQIKGKKDCFETTTIVFPNIIIEQFFKTYYLKHEGDNVLMNVEFKRLNDVLPFLVSQKNYKLIKKSNLALVIISILCNDKSNVIPIKFQNYYKDNSVKLYDFACSLANLFLSYYKDAFLISDEFKNSWQYGLYLKIIDECHKNDFGTLEMPLPKTNSNKKLYFFGFNKLDPVYSNLLKSLDFINEYSLDVVDDYVPNYVISKAPSKLREIEHIHSLISQNIISGADFSDFVIYSPSIRDYSGEIERVFHQNDTDFPNIPFVIRNSSKQESDLKNALSILFFIFKKGFFTRLDFYNLVSNPLIKESRNILDEDIDNYVKTLVDLNIYRDHVFLKDWDYLKKRLLLSKISSINFGDNVVSLIDRDYLPYSNISFDDNSIVNLIGIINDIYSFSTLLKSHKYIDNEFIDKLKIELDKWLFSNNDTTNKVSQYYKIITSLSSFKKIDNSKIPVDVLFYALFDEASVSVKQKGSAFSDGVTFIDYDINLITSAKYVFLIGASSNNLPRLNIYSELDLREKKVNNDDELTFHLLAQNALDKLYISYVCADLKKDTEYYLSPIVDSLNKKAKKYLDNNFKNIPLDEVREYKDLFTKKEFSDKNYFIDLIKNKKPDVVISTINTDSSQVSRESLTVRDLANFLKEPLQEKAKYLFNKDDDTTIKIKDEYEPFSLDNLNKSILENKVIFEMANGSFDFDALLNAFELGNKIPTINKNYEDFLYNDIVKNATETLNNISAITKNNYQILPPRSLKLITNNSKEWTLSSNNYVCLSIDGLSRTYIELKELADKPKSISRFLDLYIYSLMDIASLKDDKTYHIKLIKGIDEKGNTKSSSKRFDVDYDISTKEAIDVLNKIHSGIEDYSHNVFVPIDYRYEKIDTYTKLLNKLYNPWQYFSFLNLFNLYEDLGYDSNNFSSHIFIKELNKQIEYIKFLNPKSEEEDNENGKRRNKNTDI